MKRSKESWATEARTLRQSSEAFSDSDSGISSQQVESKSEDAFEDDGRTSVVKEAPEAASDIGNRTLYTITDHPKARKRKHRDSESESESESDIEYADGIEGDGGEGNVENMNEGGDRYKNEGEDKYVSEDYLRYLSDIEGTGDSDGDGLDKEDKNEDGTVNYNDGGGQGKRPPPLSGAFFATKARRGELKYMPQSILPTWNALSLLEQEDADQIAFLLLDGRQENETYRWPVREELIPTIPESLCEDECIEASNVFERRGMEFVEELTGVPKTDADYSEIDSSSENEAYHEELLRQRRKAKRKAKEAQHANEKASNARLKQVHGFLEREFLSFARKQYKEGAKHRFKDLHTFQEQTLPPFRNQAARSSIGTSDAGHEQEDALTPIQEKAAAFAAEDALRKVLDRLPYVIRQGALGRAPPYATKGIAKPVNTMANYERRWDTIMTAASLSGIDDRILKKVGLRMKNILSLSTQSRYYEPPSEGMFATEDVAETGHDQEGIDEDLAKLGPPFQFTGTAPPPEVWKDIPAPLYLSREYVDPQDPKYSPAAVLRNTKRRRTWLTQDLPFGPQPKDTLDSTDNRSNHSE